MVNLSLSWDNNRKLLLEALLNCESLPSPDHCGICLEGKTLIRCHDCPKNFSALHVMEMCILSWEMDLLVASFRLSLQL